MSFIFADRVQITSINQLDYVRRYRPARFLHYVPFRGVSASRRLPTTICGLTKQGMLVFFSTGKTKQRDQAATSSRWSDVVGHLLTLRWSSSRDSVATIVRRKSFHSPTIGSQCDTFPTPRADLLALRRVLQQGVLDQTYLLTCSFPRGGKLLLVHLHQPSKHAPKRACKPQETEISGVSDYPRAFQAVCTHARLV